MCRINQDEGLFLIELMAVVVLIFVVMLCACFMFCQGPSNDSKFWVNV